MGITNKISQYREFRRGVVHCTFNPDGPGVVRIHLIPPKPRLFGQDAYVVILNGYYILPLGYSWALILSRFMDEVNKHEDKEISEEESEAIVNATVKSVKRVYPFASADEIREDLSEIMRVLFAVARGDDPEAEIERLSIRAYADSMTAPHRMDLMVSAMTDESGAWKCNQRCVFCYAAGQKKSSSRELSTEEWKRVIDILGEARVPMLTFTGGEPTLRMDIAELIGYAKRFVTRLNTNGVALTPALAESLREAGLDSVQITLYSSDNEVHNSLVGASRFTDTVAGIRAALEAGLDVSVNTPLCRTNSDYVATLEFLHSLGVRFVTASGLICTGMACYSHESADLTRDELFEVIRAAKSYCDEVGMEIDFTSPGLIDADRLESLGMRVPMCGAALSNMAIAPDGEVVPCQSWLTADAGLGNILTEGFGKIWSHERARALRSMSENEALACPFRKEGGQDE